MKHTLTLIKALLLAPLAALNAAPSSDSRIVIASEAGAHLDSDVNKGGGTDDTALIQAILDRAPKLGALKLVVDGAILVKGLKVHSDTTIECLNRDCGFFLADHSDQHIIRNANQRPAGREDRNISFIGGTYNGNALKQNKRHPTLGWISAFSLHGVEQLLFRDVSITDMRTFAVHLTNWRRVVFENIYINLGQIPESSNQDGIHVQGPGEFLSMRNIQGRTWDDMIALNADDNNADWDLNRKFVRNDSFGSYASYGPITDVDIDGVQAEDCAQVIRLLSRESRIDRVSIRNVRGTYRTFGVWLSPNWREGGNIGRVELENIDLRAKAPNAFEYLPPFQLYLSGKIEHLSVRNIVNYLPIDDRPVVWIAPDAKIAYLGIHGLQIFDQRSNCGNGPIIRADGEVKILQIKDVVVQRPQSGAPAGALLATGLPREDMKKAFETSWVANNIKKPTARNTWGWPEAYSYLTSQPQIQRLQISDVVAEGLEHVLDHQAGTIEALDLRDLSIPATTKAVHQGGEGKITKTQGASFK
jgi:hypothetical protein